MVLRYKCPKGHQYGIGGYGEDLTWNIMRDGTIDECPQCRGEAELERLQLRSEHGR